jgi:elongation factor Ts
MDRSLERTEKMTTTITAQDVKKLRDQSGAGMMDCKRALEESAGDMEKAYDLLRSRGAAKAAKREGKVASEGTIGTYIHHNGKVGVMVELNCETDFVANTDAFKQLARDLAMHIASTGPLAVSASEIPEEVVARERAVYVAEVAEQRKPENVRDRIVEGKLKKFFQESTLLEQAFVKDPDKTVQDLVTEVSAKTGEKIEVRRFARFQIGAA